MTERHERILRLFDAVCDLGPEERKRKLDAECADEPEVRTEVEAMVAAHGVSTASLKGMSPDGGSASSGPATIGPYQILHEIGRGGMGIVYLGIRDDGRFRQHVAVKVVKRGMDTDEILRRFELERQVLGALNHPGIARLYSGGVTDDGLPYFAIEYIDGQPLDDYCDTHRLRIAERLELFRQVCAAVHYAHQNLVVHRDLKPSNILVTKDGVPKLLDFGIAKLINPQMSLIAAHPTAPDLRIMTPEYASPEQVRGNPITTASDVYALGVLLYELVTGHRPYRLHSQVRAEIERIICDVDPERPSTAVSRIEEVSEDGDDEPRSTTTITPEQVSKVREGRPERLRRRLVGDIDNIVLMAMRKEPQRRYASAEQFAEDIGRHLTGMPILARKDTPAYRCAKFIRRHRAGVAVAALIVLLLVGGIVTTSIQRNAAITQRDRAERMFGQVRTLAHIFMFPFYDEIKTLDGSIPARELLATTALEYLDGLAAEAGDDRDLQAELASGYEKVGDVLGGTRGPSLGRTREAMEHYRTAMRIRAAVANADPADAEARRRLAITRIRIGDAHRKLGELPEALAEYAGSSKILDGLDQADERVRRLQYVVLTASGQIKRRQGGIGAAEADYQRANTLAERLVDEHPDNRKHRRDLSVSLIRVGTMMSERGAYDEALARFERAVEIRERLAAADPESGRARRDLTMARLTTARVLLPMRRIDEAVVLLASCREQTEEAIDKSPDDARLPRDLALTYETMGRARMIMDDPQAALADFGRFRELSTALWELEPANVDNAADLALSHRLTGDALAAGGVPAGAMESYGAALEIAVSLQRDDPTDRSLDEMKAQILSAWGGVLVETGDVGARERIETALGIYESLRQSEPERLAPRLGMATTLWRLAGLAAGDGADDEATRAAREGLEVLEGAAGAEARRIEGRLREALQRSDAS